jgi:hypothetical protein
MYLDIIKTDSTVLFMTSLFFKPFFCFYLVTAPVEDSWDRDLDYPAEEGNLYSSQISIFKKDF